MALRSHTNDYIRDTEMAELRREMDIVLHELFSSDGSGRLTSLQSMGSMGSLNGLAEREVVERIRRINLIISIVNSRVSTQMLYAEVHPKLNDYGEPPREFQRPRGMAELLGSDVTIIDRILQSYNLPRDLSTLRRPDCLLGSSLLTRDNLSFGSLTMGDRLNDRLNDRYGLNREQKLLILLEHLGVDTSSERAGGVSGKLGLDGGFRRFGGGPASNLGGGLFGRGMFG